MACDKNQTYLQVRWVRDWTHRTCKYVCYKTPLIPTIPIDNQFDVLTDENSNTSMKLQDENQNINPMKTSNAETIILCDSNGWNLDPKLLCPNSTTEYVRCLTIEAANKILEQHQFSNPKTFIIHTGTNDIERCSTDNSNKTKTLLSSIRQKHPQACLILSSLLPHNDHLLQKH
jgi:hypothetical protein